MALTITTTPQDIHPVDSVIVTGKQIGRAHV